MGVPRPLRAQCTQYHRIASWRRTAANGSNFAVIFVREYMQDFPELCRMTSNACEKFANVVLRPEYRTTSSVLLINS